MARLIEPRVALAVARRISGGSELDGSYLLDRLHRDLTVAVPRSEELVADASGIAPPPPVHWGVIDRPRWAEVNIKGMSALLGPIAERLERRMTEASVPAQFVQTTAVSAEVGLLLGYVSRRVLGQYDLLVPEEAAGGSDPSLYFVGVNMVETERRLGFIPEEFALWVALHEVTHRFQFEGVPWLRERFLDLVGRYMATVELDAKGLASRLATAARHIAARDLPPEERSPIYLLASDDQRGVLNEIQALMAVVEGHGNFVMDHVGARVIPSFRQMRHLFQRRREQQSLFQRVVAQAIGLEMKMRQYELGQAFCDSVVAQGGLPALGALWESPDTLPTLEELRHPERWLRRTAA